MNEEESNAEGGKIITEDQKVLTRTVVSNE